MADSLLRSELCRPLEIVEEPGPHKDRHLKYGLPDPKGKDDKPVPAPTYLPGRPALPLDADEETVLNYAENEFVTPKLNDFAPRLWLMATPSSTHISALHHQNVRGREVVITENPELHLVWIYERVFIKPIPDYILSKAFWDLYLKPQKESAYDPERRLLLRKSVAGFLRSYFYLIQHPSDFEIATRKEHRLIPEGIGYPELIGFLSQFKDVQDAEAAPRWEYGELRLTRLNMWAKILMKGFRFQKVDAQYGAIFGRFYAPLLFIFGILSVVLGAMQVAVSVPTEVSAAGAQAIAEASKWFSVATLIGTAAIGVFLVTVLLLLILRETIYAFKKQWEKGSFSISFLPKKKPPKLSQA